MKEHDRMIHRPEAFAAIEGAGAATFTRDGRRLFFLRGAGLAQIWELDLPTGQMRQLTCHDEKVAMIRRCPVDDRVIYGIDRGGDERQQLLMLDPQRALTADHAVIHDFGGWSADGTRIAYAANARDEAHFDIFVQDVETGVRRCVWEGTGILTVAGFRPDGTQLAVLEDRGYGAMSLLLLDLATSAMQRFPEPAGTNYQSVRWASDGRTLLALTDHGGSNFMRLCRLDPDSGQVTPVYAAPDRDVEAWALSPGGATLATIENDRGYAILRIGPTGGERPVVEGLPRGVVGDLAFSPDGSALAFTASSPTEPASLWLWRDGTAMPVWRPDPPPPCVGWELVEWTSFDGMKIPGWLALPAGPVPARGHKAIIWVHGGPVGQTRPTFRPDIQMLVGQGFAVLMPNVRGSSGYGRAYAESDDLEKRLHSVTDLAHGRQWLAGHPAIDAERIGVMGQSYGGFMVNSAVTEHPDLWKAAACYYGIVDFVNTLAGTGAWRRSHRAGEYGDPERHAELFARISPIHRVDRIRVPMLVAHGARDPRVPIGESEDLVAALRERQQQVTYLTFDYAGHGFIRPDDKRRIYTAVAEFFAQHL
jgi:dipeptidyl aminopeptidase/acylaminoacyl peptidase